MGNNNHKTVRLETPGFGWEHRSGGCTHISKDIVHSNHGHAKKFAVAPSFGEQQ